MGIGVLWHLGFRNRYGVLDDSWLHRFGLPRPPSRGRSAVRRQQAGETLRPAGWAVCWGGLIQHTGQPPPFRKGRNGVKFVRHCLGVRSRKPLPLLRLTATRSVLPTPQLGTGSVLVTGLLHLEKTRYLSSTYCPNPTHTIRLIIGRCVGENMEREIFIIES
jgi:hypothetical protein